MKTSLTKLSRKFAQALCLFFFVISCRSNSNESIVQPLNDEASINTAAAALAADEDFIYLQGYVKSFGSDFRKGVKAMSTEEYVKLRNALRDTDDPQSYLMSALEKGKIIKNFPDYKRQIANSLDKIYEKHLFQKLDPNSVGKLMEKAGDLAAANTPRTNNGDLDFLDCGDIPCGYGDTPPPPKNEKCTGSPKYWICMGGASSKFAAALAACTNSTNPPNCRENASYEYTSTIAWCTLMGAYCLF